MSEESEENAIQLHIKAQLRSFRLARNWNQETMARHVGTTKAKYQKYESDNPKRHVPILVLRNFCELANVRIDDVITLAPKRRRA